MESPREMLDPISPYERPIRPLPKRRLRERLTPEAADSIRYPPSTSSMTPLFYTSYTLRENPLLAQVADTSNSTYKHRELNSTRRDHISRTLVDDLEHEEDRIIPASRVQERKAADNTARSYRYVQKPSSKLPNSHGLVSTTSSVDGYDSFENTNNKKKRKIPTPGENATHLSNELTGSSITDDHLEDTQVGVVTYHTPANASSQGLSGPGRGRYGRNRNGRSPLRTLSDSLANWGNRTPKSRPQWAAQSESPGIISRSIASANADKSPIQPAHGQENVSLLQQQASKKASPSTQFTFTCNSQVPGTASWPGATATLPHQISGSRMRSSGNGIVPVSTSQNTAIPPAPSAGQEHLPSQALNNPQKQTPMTAQMKKARRRSGKDYLIAARQRRQQQEFRNFHHPPTPEEVWICEFCEYERIFGTPPEALIRQYEIKDKRLRKQEAERRRLLEKAKLKGRKGKKGAKATPKVPAAPYDRHVQHQDQRQVPVHQSHSQGTQSEEYYDDEDDDDYTQDEPPPPSPTSFLVTEPYQLPPLHSDENAGAHHDDVQPILSNRNA